MAPQADGRMTDDERLERLLADVSREVAEMIFACLPDAIPPVLASDEECERFSRCIEAHRLVAERDRRPFAAAAADGLIAAVHHHRHRLRIRQDRPGTPPLPPANPGE